MKNPNIQDTEASENLDINTKGGNYNENIEGNYIQQQYNIFTNSNNSSLFSKIKMQFSEKKSLQFITLSFMLFIVMIIIHEKFQMKFDKSQNIVAPPQRISPQENIIPGNPQNITNCNGSLNQSSCNVTGSVNYGH